MQQTADTVFNVAPCILISSKSVTLARLICKLPDDGRRPKHVGAILIQGVPLATERAGWRTAAPCRNNQVHYRHIPFHFSHNKRTPVQISLQYLHWCQNYEGWNFNSGNYLFTTYTKQIHVQKFYCPSMQSPALCTTSCQRCGSRRIPLAAPVVLIVRMERSTA